MIRKAFKMVLHPNKVSEYSKRHNPIWDELKTILKTHGVVNYCIFFDEDTNILFAYAEIQSEEQWNSIADTEICKKWWAYMSDIMQTNQNNSPVTKELLDVFNLN